MGLVEYVVRQLERYFPLGAEEHVHKLQEISRSERGTALFTQEPRYDFRYMCTNRDQCNLPPIFTGQAWEIPPSVGKWKRHEPTREGELAQRVQQDLYR